MPDTILRGAVKAALDKKVGDEAGYLATHANDTLDQMRFRQGRIRGLKDALDVLEAEYRNMHG